ncbi:pyocin knob domain-containing protein [Pseudomonas simiae]|uniref:pyocin knob domain-containing protein n=1 Tax=Pseudomonas simiae TaxID=321846 RepID=UPI003D6B947D
MVWQRAGTVAVQNGSSTVIGTNVDFAASSRIGDSFVGPDGATYELANVASSTVISILPAYKGPTVSGAAYAIMPVQGYDKMLSDAFNNLNNQFGPKLAALGTTGNYDILPETKGGTGRTAVGTAISANVATSSSDATSGRLLAVGHAGFNGGGGLVQPSSVDANSLITSGVYIFSNGGNANTPTNLGYMIVLTHPSAGYCRQVFKSFNTNAYFERFQSTGTWSAWDQVYGATSSVLDPQTAGGLMSMTAVSGFTVFKYANGQMIVQGPVPTTAIIAANTQFVVSVSIPVSFPVGFVTLVGTLYPSVGNDFAIRNTQAPGTTAYLFCANGTSAQSFSGNIALFGRWK